MDSSLSPDLIRRGVRTQTDIDLFTLSLPVDEVEDKRSKLVACQLTQKAASRNILQMKLLEGTFTEDN